MTLQYQRQIEDEMNRNKITFESLPQRVFKTPKGTVKAIIFTHTKETDWSKTDHYLAPATTINADYILALLRTPEDEFTDAFTVPANEIPREYTYIDKKTGQEKTWLYIENQDGKWLLNYAKKTPTDITKWHNKWDTIR